MNPEEYSPLLKELLEMEFLAAINDSRVVLLSDDEREEFYESFVKEYREEVARLPILEAEVEESLIDKQQILSTLSEKGFVWRGGRHYSYLQRLKAGVDAGSLNPEKYDEAKTLANSYVLLRLKKEIKEIKED